MIGDHPLWLVIPAFNAEATVSRAAAGVAHLPGGSRAVVVDDGSTDGTIGAARAAGAEVLTQRNTGPSGARNAALDAAAAAGADVLLLDADDELVPGCWAALESAARGSAESRLVIGEFRRVRQGRAVDNGMERVSEVLARMGGDPAAALLPDTPLSASGLLVPHATLADGIRFDPGLRTHEDRDFVFRAAGGRPLACTAGPVALKHEHDGQMTVSPGLAEVFLRDCLAFLERHRASMPAGQDSRLGAALRHYLKRYAKASVRLRRPIDRSLWARAVTQLHELNERPGWRTERYRLLATAASVLRPW
ncbi:MAG: glycosyltransferase [Phycisphaerae bacterium]|nr:glycosyltransferase [Phycisphaerae bacterium]